MARPELPIDIKTVEECAGLGMTLEEIAAACGVSYKTLARRKQVLSVLSDAVEAGKAKTKRKIGNALFDQAMSGWTPAIIWFEKTRFKYRDAADVTSNGKEVGVVGFHVIPPSGEPTGPGGEDAGPADRAAISPGAVESLE